MNGIQKLTAGVAFFIAFATPASALTISGSDIQRDPLIRSSNSYVQYLVDDRPANTANFGGGYWDIDGLGTYFALCADAFLDDYVAASYTVATDLSVLGPLRTNQLSALFSNAFPLLQAKADAYTALNGTVTANPLFQSEWSELAAYSFALQILTWNIMENEATTVTPNAGMFGIVPANSDPFTAGLVLDWASKLNDGQWVVVEGVSVHYAVSSNGDMQNRFWMTLSPSGAVPEPATWAMLIAGFGLVGAMARRQRGTAIPA